MFGGDFVNVIQRTPQLRLLIAGARLFGQRNPVLFGQLFEGFPEGKPLNHHDEVEYVTLGVAAKALEELMLGVDRK